MVTNPSFRPLCLSLLLCMLSFLGGCQRSTAPAPIEWGYKKAVSYQSRSSRPAPSRVIASPQKRAAVVSKPLDPVRMSPSKKQNEIQIIEISDNQEKVISHKKEASSVDSLEIIEISQEGQVEVLEGTPKPDRKPSQENEISEESSKKDEEDISGLPTLLKKPISEDVAPPKSESDSEPHPKSMSEDGVPVPSHKPAIPPVVPPSLTQSIRQNVEAPTGGRREVETFQVIERTPKEVPSHDSQEESLFWEEESAPSESVASPAPKQERAALKVEDYSSSASTSSALFSWPLKGKVLKGFSKSGSQNRNDGLNIEGAIGDPVRAARQGQVVYVGNELHGFGHLVLIKHDDEWMSAYAHLGQVHVQRGDVVRRSQVIATVGSSGSVAHPQLHFEVRRRSQPVDPKRFLE